MAYNNYSPMTYPYSYQTYQYSPQAYASQPQQTQAQPTSNLIWVQGEAGAKSYLVAPNNTVTLWDTESQTIYIKSADASGMPSMKVLDYTMRGESSATAKIPPQNGFATKDDLDYLKGEIEALKAKFEEKKK